jgi:HEAT repeat protein
MERSLQSRSSWIRDAAALGLEAMDDPAAIPYLKEALGREPNSELRRYLQSVLEYLQRKR